jgi:hypothetical protein
MRTERIERAAPQLEDAGSSPGSQTPAAFAYVPSSPRNPLELDASAAGRPHLRNPTLVAVAAAAYAIGVLALFTQRWTVVLPAAALFQLALVVVLLRGRGSPSATGITGPVPTRTGRVTSSRADAWLLAESLADLASHPLPRPSGPGAGDHAIISRRNRSALEFFPSEDAARQTLDHVLRLHPHLEGRFAVENTSVEVS